METALSRNEPRFAVERMDELAAIVEFSDDAIIGKTLQGIITSWNEGARRLLGYRAEEIVGQPVSQLIPSDRGNEEMNILTRLQRGERIEHFETVRRRKDGSLVEVSLSISPIRDQSGRLVGAAKIARDISERKRREEELKTSLNEVNDLKTALDEHAIVAITDPQGKITYVNDKFCAISKYSREELIGQDHRIINSGHHPKEFIRELWTTIARGKVWKGEIKNKAKDGTFYWVDTTIVPFLNEQHKPRQYVAIRADITARKQIEEKLGELNADLEQRVITRTAELETANKELEAFSYSISHDLRAPLRAINGFAGFVLEDFSSQLPEEGRQYLERVREGGKRMGELIDDLLTFSRLSRQPVKRDTVDTVKVVKNVLEELKPQQGVREIELRIAKLPFCEGDPVLLRQVWVNLLSNAIKYTRARKPAIVEIGYVCLNGENVYFVRDNGTGFDMQYANKLFGVFQRLHSSNEFEGTGVGLAIVQRIIHRHGGRVWAEASVERGATFYFTLQAGNKV
jgi:PAS domain S-box-containing protein